MEGVLFQYSNTSETVQQSLAQSPVPVFQMHICVAYEHIKGQSSNKLCDILTLPSVAKIEAILRILAFPYLSFG